MSIDFDKIPPAKRDELIELGQHFGSQDTLAQGLQTLAGCKKHGAELALYGVGAKQVQELEDLCDALKEAGVGREAARGEKKVNGLLYVEAMEKGEAARLGGRAVLTAAAEDLERSEGAGAAEGVKVAKAALVQTKISADKAEPLAQQLGILLGALKQTVIADAALGMGGPEAVTGLEDAIGGLRKADQESAGRLGTPAETQRLDLIDGMIVQLVRRVKRAAVAAGRATGSKALSAVFKLDKLYGHRAKAPEGESEGEGEAAEGEAGLSED